MDKIRSKHQFVQFLAEHMPVDSEDPDSLWALILKNDPVVSNQVEETDEAAHRLLDGVLGKGGTLHLDLTQQVQEVRSTDMERIKQNFIAQQLNKHWEFVCQHVFVRPISIHNLIITQKMTTFIGVQGRYRANAVQARQR